MPFDFCVIDGSFILVHTSIGSFFLRNLWHTWITYVACFIQTICGEYRPDTELDIIPNVEERSFIIQNDIWKMDEDDEDAFHLVDIY
ncbi:MAG: hypothetical protein ACRDBO_01310 [Lachnospiraceae bacterium]